LTKSGRVEGKNPITLLLTAVDLLNRKMNPEHFKTIQQPGAMQNAAIFPFITKRIIIKRLGEIAPAVYSYQWPISWTLLPVSAGVMRRGAFGSPFVEG
jgi:hypothetical protein